MILGSLLAFGALFSFLVFLVIIVVPDSDIARIALKLFEHMLVGMAFGSGTWLVFMAAHRLLGG